MTGIEHLSFSGVLFRYSRKSASCLLIFRSRYFPILIFLQLNSTNRLIRQEYFRRMYGKETEARSMAERSGDDIILEAIDLWFTYEETGEHSLRGVNLKIKRGSRVAFMGANGSGKSTFFLCCNGIYRPEKGELRFNGNTVRYRKKDLRELRSKVGIVFQDPDDQLFSASVEQEISFGILNLGADMEKASEEVKRVMDLLEITPFKDRPVHALSGGQKKQVSIADILVMHPEVVILDEPAAALDPKHTKLVKNIVNHMTEQGITVLMSTHDIDYAYAWADEIVLMHEGKVLLQGRAPEVCRNKEALRKTNLEEPAVLRMFDRLCEKGILDASGIPPFTLDELEERIQAAVPENRTAAGRL